MFYPYGCIASSPSSSPSSSSSASSPFSPSSSLSDTSVDFSPYSYSSYPHCAPQCREYSTDMFYADSEQCNLIHSLLLPREVGLYRNSLVWKGSCRCPSYRQRRSSPKACAHRLALQKLPSRLTEHEFPELIGYDKIFASQWLDEHTIVTGAKDNKLIVWDIEKNPVTRRIIPLPPASRYWDPPTCGIHSVVTNPSRTLLASGSSNPSELAVFDVPSYELRNVLRGHSDWSFCSAFVSEDRVVSGSRDSTLSLWTLDKGNTDSYIQEPLATRQRHIRKIRDLVYNPDNTSISTLSADGTLKLWDLESFDVISQHALQHSLELICTALDPATHLVAVGSQRFVSLIDQRSNASIQCIPSVDLNWGVRSLGFRSFLLTIGAGYGSLAFFDMRTGKYMNLHRSDQTSDRRSQLTTGKGWLDMNSNFFELFSSSEVRNAVYTHSFDQDGTRLFVAGGPLMLGLRGCYAAIWQ